jgi:hypothetical protein
MPERWPNFFLAGTPKAGTTSLYRYLGQHPEIHMAPEKEPHFFDVDWEATEGDRQARQAAIEDYLALFADAEEPVRGEATPGYFGRPGVFERIRKHCPEARFLVSLRDPVAAIHSAYLMRVRRGRGTLEDEPAGFRDYVASILEAEPGTRERYPIEGRRYATHYERFREVFDEEQIHVILLDDLSEHPRRTLREIAAFLDVDPDGVEHVDLETVHNPFGTPRNRVAEWLLNDDRVRRLAQLVLPEPVRVFLGEHALVTKDGKPPRGEEAVAMIADELAPEVRELADLLDRDLSPLEEGWSDVV